MLRRGGGYGHTSVANRTCRCAGCGLISAAPAATASAWNRDAARDYALDWDGSARNSNFKDFSSSGGDCANYVSQRLHAHDHKDLGHKDGLDFVPDSGEMNSVGVDGYYQSQGYGWYMFWVPSPWKVWQYTDSWKDANTLHHYFRDSDHFGGYRSLIGTYDFDSSTEHPAPPLNQGELTCSDVVSYDFHKDDNGGDFNVGHIAFAVRNNARSRFDYPALMENDAYQGDLISCHTTDRVQVLWSCKDVFLWPGSDEYEKHSRDDWKIAAWRLSSDCD